MERQSLNEAFGIDKPEDWFKEQYATCHRTLSENENIMSAATLNFLMETKPAAVLVIKLNHMEQVLSALIQMVYTLGYCKGKVEQEKVAGLDKLWNKESG